MLGWPFVDASTAMLTSMIPYEKFYVFIADPVPESRLALKNICPSSYNFCKIQEKLSDLYSELKKEEEVRPVPQHITGDLLLRIFRRT
jgi:hypothetical protein